MLFSTESIGEEKKVFIIRDEAPIFSEVLGFSLLTLYVNAALGFRPTVLAFSFCSPHPTNKILKKTSLDLKLFPGF